jgi:hypothetical protein
MDLHVRLDLTTDGTGRTTAIFTSEIIGGGIMDLSHQDTTSSDGCLRQEIVTTAEETVEELPTQTTMRMLAGTEKPSIVFQILVDGLFRTIRVTRATVQEEQRITKTPPIEEAALPLPIKMQHKESSLAITKNRTIIRDLTARHPIQITIPKAMVNPEAEAITRAV